jgi:hypothetical protein
MTNVLGSRRWGVALRISRKQGRREDEATYLVGADAGPRSWPTCTDARRCVRVWMWLSAFEAAYSAGLRRPSRTVPLRLTGTKLQVGMGLCEEALMASVPRGCAPARICRHRLGQSPRP